MKPWYIVRCRWILGVLLGWGLAVQAQTSEWLVMVYIAADNNLDPAAIGDITEMEAAGGCDEVKIAVLMDRAEDADWTEARRFLIRGKDALPDEGHSYDTSLDTCNSMGELNMGDPETLTTFMRWATQTYPARKTMLILWNHGGGWRDVYSRAVMATRAPDLPTDAAESLETRLSRGIAWDDSDGHDFLEMREVRAVLEAFPALSVIGMDACLMAMAEVAYEIRDQAEFLVGSQDLEPGAGWPYTGILKPLYQNPSMDAEALSRLIVQAYQEEYHQQSGTTQSALRLSKMEQLAKDVDRVAELLLQALAREGATAPDLLNGDIPGVPKGSVMFLDLDGFLVWCKGKYGEDTDKAVDQARATLQEAIILSYAHEEHRVTGLAVFPGGNQGGDYVEGIIQWAKTTRWDEFLARVKHLRETTESEPSGLAADRWAVIIGIDTYDDETIPDLQYAARDAEYLHTILTEDVQIPADHVVTLLNRDASLARVRSTLGTWLPRTVGKDDMVLIYYSGHGGAEPSLTGQSDDGTEKYIMLSDSRVDDMYSTALPMSELSRIFGRIQADKLLLVMDSCYSGASGGRGLLRTGMKAVGMSDDYMSQLAATEGTAILTASRASEVSMESPDFGHGIFTYHLGEALQGAGDANSDQIITLSELYQYVSTEVPATAKKFGASQNPVLKGEVTGTFPIADVRAKASVTTTPADQPPPEPVPVAAGTSVSEAIRPERPVVTPSVSAKAKDPMLVVASVVTRGRSELACTIQDWPDELRDANAWIGFYRGEAAPDDQYLSYTFIKNLIKDTYTVERPMDPGAYQFRLFRDSKYDRLASSPPVIIE